MKNVEKKRETVEIDRNLLDWIKKRQKDNFFASTSDGIRKSVECAKRVYESQNKDDILKYLMGIKI